MLILWSAPSQRYSLDIDYEYRQDSNLYYLTGLTQEDTILVLMPGNKTQREMLFVKDRNPAREQWTGTLLTLEQAKSQTGVDRVFRASQFDEIIAGFLNRLPVGGDEDPIDASRFFEALSAGRARVALALGPASVERRADAGAGVRPEDPRTLRRVPDGRRRADPERSAAGQNAVRAARS